MISSPPKGRQTRKAKRRYTSGKCLKGIGEQQVDGNVYVMNIAAAALDKVLGKFLKMFPSKRAVSTNQAALGVEPTKWVQLLNDAISLFPLHQVIPHPSFFASTNIGSIFISVFNLVQSALSDSPGNFHQNAAKHQKLDTNCLKDSCVFFRSHRPNSFIHTHFLRRNTLYFADFGHLRTLCPVFVGNQTNALVLRI